jgi:uncharacterized protein involved in exopolysaccharide biosynthesis
MNQRNSLESNTDHSLAEDEISLLDLVSVISENLRLLVFGPLLCGIVALGITFLTAPIFTAKTTILPPSQGGNASSLLGALGGLGDLAGAAAGIKNPSEQYVAYLKSDTLRNELIRKFDLQKRYDQEFLFQTRDKLDKLVKIAAEKQSGLISIEVDDEDPVFAAKLANAYVDELRVLTGKLAAVVAKDQREFMEEQVAEALKKNYQSPMVREMVIQGLIRSYETARIDEQKNGPMFTQVDVAQPPEWKSKPKRGLIAVLVTLATGFLLLLFVFVRSAFRNAGNDPESSEKLAFIKQQFKKQLRFK